MFNDHNENPVKVDAHDAIYKGIRKNKVNVFYGIPYAELPQNDRGQKLNFSYPLDFNEIYPEKKEIDCFEYGPISLQTTIRTTNMSAACQNLNLWMPYPATDELRPVLFYVHGGSFMSNSNRSKTTDGYQLAKKLGIIVIGINYRIGPWGFFDLSPFDSRFDANCAFADILSALRWVQRNIEAFGGDPDNVTLIGQSSGGSVVSVFPFMEQAKNLFHKLIILSGIPTAYTGLEDNQNLANKFLHYCKIDSVDELLAEEKQKSLAAKVKLFSRVCKRGVTTYLPAVDGKIIKQTPLASARYFRLHNRELPYPIWLNMTLNELSFMATYSTFANVWGMKDVYSGGKNQESDNIVTNMSKAYQDNYSDETTASAQFYSDMIIRIALIWYAEEIASYGKTYFTCMDWATKLLNKLNLGAYHASDLHLFFANDKTGAAALLFKGSDAEKQAFDISGQMQADLNSFMRNGYILDVEGREELAAYSLDDHLIKTYDIPGVMRKVAPDDVREVWEKTRYHDSSFSYESWSDFL